MKQIALLVMTIAAYAVWAGRAGFSVLVLDSGTGEPVRGIKIEGSFLNYSKGWGGAASDNDVDALTDANGTARLSGNTEKGVGGYRIYHNAGYYNAEWTQIQFHEQSVFRLGAWVPSDIVSTVRLDRVVCPIPLHVKYDVGEYRKKDRAYHEIYAREKDLSATNDVPIVRDAVLAYDIVKGAWLPPHGNGETADMQFTFNETVMGWEKGRSYDGHYVKKKYRTTMSVSMPGAGNGIVEIPVAKGAGIQVREAPSDGYSSGISRWIGWLGGGDGTKTDGDACRCYAFRIRTRLDDSGNVRSACYGKVYGDFDMTDVDGVRFLYYLNPTPNDRNLEWDRKNNLCPDPGDIGIPRP